jgi:hypothetical protein
MPSVVAQICTQEAKAGVLQLQGQSVPHSKFEASVGYVARPFPKKKK